MMLERLGKIRTYEFCIEGATDDGYPFAETGYVYTSSFNNAVRTIQDRMAKKNEMRYNYGLSGTYTDITELTMVKRDANGK